MILMINGDNTNAFLNTEVNKVRFKKLEVKYIFHCTGHGRRCRYHSRQAIRNYRCISYADF